MCHDYKEVIMCPNRGCNVVWCVGTFRFCCAEWAWDAHHRLSCGKAPYALHRVVCMLKEYEPDIHATIVSMMGPVLARCCADRAKEDAAVTALQRRLDSSPTAVPRRLREATDNIAARIQESKHWRLQNMMGAPLSSLQPRRIDVTPSMLAWVARLNNRPTPENPKVPFWGYEWDKSVLKEFRGDHVCVNAARNTAANSRGSTPRATF